jgi:hypothetical protein
MLLGDDALKNRDKKNEVIKITKMNKGYKRKLIIILVWIFIGFLIIRGVGTIIKGNKINLKPFKNEITKNIDKKTVESEATAFAENFTNEYFSYNGDDDEYYSRLAKYTNLDFSATKLEKMDVVYVNIIKSNWQTDKLLIVDLKVKISEIPDGDFIDKYIDNNQTSTNQKNNSKSTSMPQLTNTDNYSLYETLYFRVPISTDKGFVVCNYPTFIGTPSINKDENENKLPGNLLKDENTIKEIEKLVDAFLNGYYKGDSTELSYYMKDKESKINCINSSKYEIGSIDKIIINEYKEKYYVKTSYQIKYKENLIENGMEFRIVKINEKLFVEEFNSAIGVN